MSIYYIADCHFGHANVIRFDQRPFFTTEDMEEIMIMNWDATVRPGDHVYILGDFCWGKADEWLRILRKLPGQKHLILGNHDLTHYLAELQAQFVEICDYKEITDNGRKVIMSHYPILFYKHSNNERYFMLHGHVHSTLEYDYLERFKAQLREETRGDGNSHFRNLAQIYNVGVMMPWMRYTPRTLDEILRWHQQNK